MFVDKDEALKFKCSKCAAVYLRAFKDACGHFGCDNCLKSLPVEGGKVRCPVNNELVPQQSTFDQVKTDALQQLVISCPAGKECTKQFTIAQLDHHNQNECQLTKIKCDVEKAKGELCGYECQRNLMEKHKITCEWQVKDCEFCGSKFRGNDTIMEEHHNSDCQEIPIDCAKKCIVKHRRKFQELHDKFNCQKKVEDCYFRSAGCFFTGNWDEMGRHSSEAFIIHAQFLEQKLQHFEAYRKVVDQLVKEIQADPIKYADLQKYTKDIDSTEDNDYQMFQGAFDPTYSSKRFTFEENANNRIVSTKPGAINQILYFDRRFHERHRIVINIHTYNPVNSDPQAIGFRIGLVRKGVLLEEEMYEWIEVKNDDAPKEGEKKGRDPKRRVTPYREFLKNFKLFTGVAKDATPGKDQIQIEAGQDYMLSYDPDTARLIFENLNMEKDNPPIVEMDLPTEFWEYQPALILSHEVKVELMDFNDWNQH